MSLFVKSAFAGASIQDDGRPGMQRYGVTLGGAVDKLALAQGRLLLNDHGNTAVIEFSAVGGQFIAQKPSFFAFTGAEAPLSLNGKLIPNGQVFEAQAGDEIKNPRKNIPRAILISLAIVVTLYILFTFVFIGGLNQNDVGGPSWEFIGGFGEFGIIFQPAHNGIHSNYLAVCARTIIPCTPIVVFHGWRRRHGNPSVSRAERRSGV